IPGQRGFDGDGGPAIKAKLNWPSSVFADPDCNVLIADSGNGVVRRVDSAGMITTVAGTPRQHRFDGDGDGDGGPATKAKFNGPSSVFVDRDRSVLIVDSLNHVVRLLEGWFSVEGK